VIWSASRPANTLGKDVCDAIRSIAIPKRLFKRKPSSASATTMSQRHLRGSSIEEVYLPLCRSLIPSIERTGLELSGLREQYIMFPHGSKYRGNRTSIMVDVNFCMFEESHLLRCSTHEPGATCSFAVKQKQVPTTKTLLYLWLR